MGNIVRPVFGKPCRDCGEQVPQARVRVIEGDAYANGSRFTPAIVCVDCQQLRENEVRRARRAERASDTMVITRRR